MFIYTGSPCHCDDFLTRCCSEFEEKPFKMKLNKQPLGLPAYRPALEQQPAGSGRRSNYTFNQPTRLNRCAKIARNLARNISTNCASCLNSPKHTCRQQHDPLHIMKATFKRGCTEEDWGLGRVVSKLAGKLDTKRQDDIYLQCWVVNKAGSSC